MVQQPQQQSCGQCQQQCTQSCSAPAPSCQSQCNSQCTPQCSAPQQITVQSPSQSMCAPSCASQCSSVCPTPTCVSSCIPQCTSSCQNNCQSENQCQTVSYPSFLFPPWNKGGITLSLSEHTRRRDSNQIGLLILIPSSFQITLAIQVQQQPQQQACQSSCNNSCMNQCQTVSLLFYYSTILSWGFEELSNNVIPSSIIHFRPLLRISVSRCARVSARPSVQGSRWRKIYSSLSPLSVHSRTYIFDKDAITHSPPLPHTHSYFDTRNISGNDSRFVTMESSSAWNLLCFSL